jgi:hypothetical protein
LKKEDVKKNDPKGTPKILMLLIKVQKPNGGENSKKNPKGDQASQLWG